MKYVVKDKDGEYVLRFFLVRGEDNEGLIVVDFTKNKDKAVTLTRKYLALAIAKTVNGKIEETKE